MTSAYPPILNIFLRNVCRLSNDYTALYAKSPTSLQDIHICTHTHLMRTDAARNDVTRYPMDSKTAEGNGINSRHPSLKERANNTTRTLPLSAVTQFGKGPTHLTVVSGLTSPVPRNVTDWTTESRFDPLLHSVQPYPGTHPASYLLGKGDLSARHETDKSPPYAWSHSSTLQHVWRAWH